MSPPAQKRAIKQERAARTRKEILDAAIRLFARKGLLATTMAQLAKEIGMTPGALYWHFPTKEDLLLGAIEELDGRYREAWRDLTTEGRKLPARDQMHAFFLRTNAFVRDNRHYGMFLGLLAAESPELSARVAAALRDAMAVYVQVLTGIIKHGQQRTFEFREDLDARTLAHALIAAHMGAVIHSNLFDPALSYDEIIAALEKVTAPGMERGVRPS